MAKLKQTATKTAAVMPKSDQYTPDFAIAGNGPRPPMLVDCPPFLYRHHPERWHVMNGAVLPVLGKFQLKAGLNRVEHRGGKFMIAQAQAEIERRGWTIIPIDVQGPGTSYIRRPEGTNAHLSQWAKTYSGSTQIDCDVDGWTKFCKMLIKNKVIEAPGIHVLERIRSKTQQQYTAAADRAVSVPSEKAIADKFAADIAVLDKEIAKRKKNMKPATSTSTVPVMGDA